LRQEALKLQKAQNSAAEPSPVAAPAAVEVKTEATRPPLIPPPSSTLQQQQSTSKAQAVEEDAVMEFEEFDDD